MARKLTHEEFLEKFYKSNDKSDKIEILGTYVNTRTEIHCKCKVDGHEWYPTAGALLANQGCPQCAYTAVGNKLHKPFETWVEIYKEKYPNSTIKFLGEIKSGKYYKIQCECTVCGYTWTARAIDLLKRGTGCAICSCSGGDKRTHEQFLQVFNRKNPFKDSIEFLSQYTSASEPIKCLCKQCGHEWETTPTNLCAGKGCRECAIKGRGIKLQKPISHFLNQLEECSFKDNLDFQESEYVAMKTKMHFTCKIDGYKWTATPDQIIHSKYGCPKCAIREQAKRLTSTHDEFLDKLKSVNPYYEVLSEYITSKDKILVRCTLCGHEQWTRPNDLLNGKNCSNCSDGISYPNKFSHAFLKQLPVENVHHEYCPEWSNGKRYDNYFEYQGQGYILEMDGKQHFVDMSTSCWGALDETQKNDKYKDELALANGVDVIRISCMDTYRTSIKQEIINSKLGTLFDLSNIDWKQCDVFARSNLVKEVWNYYNTNPLAITDEISKIFGISIITARKYLNKGNQLGICNYNKKEIHKRMNLKKGTVT